MKKLYITLIAATLVSVLASCGSKVNIDELISARELPEYSKPGSSVNIKIDDSDNDSDNAIVID